MRRPGVRRFGLKDFEESCSVTWLDEKMQAPSSSLTHAVDIFAFVEARDIPFLSFDTPYYLSPPPGGEKVYALLREALNRTKKVGIAYVVIKSRRHLAVVAPCGPALLLTTLLKADTAYTSGAMPAASDKLDQIRISEDELSEAAHLIDRMTRKWNATEYADDLENGITESVSEALDANAAEYAMMGDDLFDLFEEDNLRLPMKSLMRRERLMPRPHRESWPRSRARRLVN